MSSCSEEPSCMLLPTTSVEFILSIVHALEQACSFADDGHVERDALGILLIEDSIVGVVDLCPDPHECLLFTWALFIRRHKPCGDGAGDRNCNCLGVRDGIDP